MFDHEAIRSTLQSLKCRPYQSNYVSANFSGWAKECTGLNVAATGAGKTWIGASTIRCWLDHSKGKVLWIAHRRELNKQALAAIEAITGHKPDLEMGESRVQTDSLYGSSPIVVASIQSLMAGPKCNKCNGTGGVLVPCSKCVSERNPTCKKCHGTGEMPSEESCPVCIGGKVRRLQKFDPSEFGLIVTDEGHRSLANSYKRTYRWFGKNPNARFLMLTATPMRGDEQSLGDLCDFVADVHGEPQFGEDAAKADIADIRWCIEEGWLVPVQQRFIECTSIDLREVGTSNGELATGDLEAVMLNERALHEMVAGTVQHTGDKKTVIFCVDRAHAAAITDMLNRDGYKPGSARLVTGETEDSIREEIIAGHKSGEFQYLVNVDIVTEGYDDPEIECVVMMRPRKTKGPYVQSIGRATRPVIPPDINASAMERKAAIAASRKPFCEVIDFHGHNGKHKLVTTLDIMGGGNIRAEVLDRARKISSDEQKAETPEDLLARAEAELAREEEERKAAAELARRAKLAAAKAEFRVTNTDPFSWMDRVDTGSTGTEVREASHAQKEALVRMGLSQAEVNDMTHKKAVLMLKTLNERRSKGLCTYKQAKMLAKRGIDTRKLTKEKASRAIDAMIKANWQITQDVLKHCQEEVAV